MSSIMLTPVTQSGYWRVKIAWPEVSPRYFGKFRSREEAEKWIEKHCWVTKQTSGRHRIAPVNATLLVNQWDHEREI